MAKSIMDLAKAAKTGVLKATKPAPKPAPLPPPPQPPVAKRVRTPVSASNGTQTMASTANAPQQLVYAEAKVCPPAQTTSRNGDLCNDSNGFPTGDVPREKPKQPPPKK